MSSRERLKGASGHQSWTSTFALSWSSHGARCESESGRVHPLAVTYRSRDGHHCRRQNSSKCDSTRSKQLNSPTLTRRRARREGNFIQCDAELSMCVHGLSYLTPLTCTLAHLSLAHYSPVRSPFVEGFDVMRRDMRRSWEPHGTAGTGGGRGPAAGGLAAPSEVPGRLSLNHARASVSSTALPDSGWVG
jgi:hypothetical protein